MIQDISLHFACTAINNGKRYVFAIAWSPLDAIEAHKAHAKAKGLHGTLHSAFINDQHASLEMLPTQNVMFIDETIEPKSENTLVDAGYLCRNVRDEQFEHEDRPSFFRVAEFALENLTK